MTASPFGYEARPHPTANQEQTLTVDATGGTYTLAIVVPGHATVTTAAIDFDAVAATVESAIDTALGTTGVVCEDVTGGVGDEGGTTPYVVTLSVPCKVTPDSTSLTGGATTASIEETSEGQYRVVNGTELTLPIEALPDKIDTATGRTAYDRDYETTV